VRGAVLKAVEVDAGYVVVAAVAAAIARWLVRRAFLRAGQPADA
jgi:hypothetical protein